MFLLPRLLLQSYIKTTGLLWLQAGRREGYGERERGRRKKAGGMDRKEENTIRLQEKHFILKPEM